MNFLQRVSICTALGDLLACRQGAEPVGAAVAVLRGLLCSGLFWPGLSEIFLSRTTVTMQIMYSYC
jgi:hypothetical protein